VVTKKNVEVVKANVNNPLDPASESFPMMIAIIVIVVLLLVIAAAAAVVFLCRKKKKKGKVSAGVMLYAGYEWKDKQFLFAEIRRAQHSKPTKDANLQELVEAVETGNAQQLAQQLVYGCKPIRLGGGLRNKRTLLMDAVQNAGKVRGGEADKVVELLVHANPKLVNKVDNDGNTALHFAANAGNWDAMATLENAGAKRLKNNDGQMPSHNPKSKHKNKHKIAPAEDVELATNKQPQTELAHVGGEMLLKGLPGNEEKETKQVLQNSLADSLQEAGMNLHPRNVKIKSYYVQRTGAVLVKYEVAMEEPQELAESLMKQFQTRVNTNPKSFYGAVKRHAASSGLSEQPGNLNLLRSKALTATQVERTTIGPSKNRRRNRHDEEAHDPDSIDRRRVGPSSRSRRRLDEDDETLGPTAPTREGHVKKAVVGPGRKRRAGRARGRGRGRGTRVAMGEEDFEPETTVVKARIGPGRRQRGRGRGRGRSRNAAAEGDGDVTVSKARIGPQRRRAPRTTNVTRTRIGPGGRRARAPMRDGGRTGARRVRKTGNLPTDVPIISGVLSFTGLSLPELKQPELESGIRYALADGPHKLNVKVLEDDDITFSEPKPDQNDGFQLGFKMALRDVSEQAQAETVRNQIKNLVSRANGRSFVNSIKRNSDDVSISSKAISVKCFGEMEVIMPNAPLVNIASADVGRVSVLAGKAVRDDVAAKVSGAVILNGLNEDVSKKTLVNAFKGTMADIPYELGFHTSPNDVQILRDDLKGDQMHLDFEIMLGKEDVKQKENLDELVQELNGAMSKNGGREMLSALKRKNQELGDGALDNANMTLTVVNELTATMMTEEDEETDAISKDTDSEAGISSIGLLTALSTLVKARTKFSSLFKTMKGSVNLKGVKAEEFDASASMHKALKDALMTILLNLGLSRQNARIKLMDAKNVSSDKITVSYRIRLRSDAKDLAEAVLQALKKTFSEKSSRTKFLEGFWKTHRTMDSRLKRRMQRQERRRLGTKKVQEQKMSVGMKDDETQQVASVAKTRQVGPTVAGRRRRAGRGRGATDDQATRARRRGVGAADEATHDDGSVAVNRSRVGPAGRRRARGRGALRDVNTGEDNTRRRTFGRGARREQNIETEDDRAVPVEKARVGPSRRRRGRGRGRQPSMASEEDTIDQPSRVGPRTGRRSPVGRGARRRVVDERDSTDSAVGSQRQIGPTRGRGRGRQRRVLAEERAGEETVATTGRRVGPRGRGASRRQLVAEEGRGAGSVVGTGRRIGPSAGRARRRRVVAEGAGENSSVNTERRVGPSRRRRAANTRSNVGAS